MSESHIRTWREVASAVLAGGRARSEIEIGELWNVVEEMADIIEESKDDTAVGRAVREIARGAYRVDLSYRDHHENGTAQWDCGYWDYYTESWHTGSGATPLDAIDMASEGLDEKGPQV